MGAMKFFKNLFGFSDDYEQDDSNEQTTQNTPYINPFKKETPKVVTPPKATPAVEKAAQEVAFSDVITTKIIEILNAGLPEYARTSIDIKAEKAYVEQLFGETISEFAAKVKDSATEDNKSKWQADLLSLEKDKATAEKTVAEMTAKIQELRTRIQNSDSQKEIFKEKSKQLENKINTVIAERDQFELECKSLMNKIKVAAINEQNVTALTDENQKLSAENVNLHAEILKLRNEKGEGNDDKINEANAKIAEKDGIIAENNAAIATKDAKIESLKAQIESLTAQSTQNAKADEIIEGLQNQVKSLADSNYSLQEQINTLKETESALNEQIATLKNDANNSNHEEVINALAAKDAEIAAKEATIAELNSKMNDLSIVAGDKTAEIGRLNENTTALNETINKLREEINAANEAQRTQEVTFRTEIDKLQKANNELEEELQKAKRPVETITFDEKPEAEETAVAEPEPTLFGEEEKPVKATRGRKKKVVSAIDYTTKDYTDWLMPTPPSTAIPIDDEPEEKPEKPAKPQPSQMELF